MKLASNSFAYFIMTHRMDNFIDAVAAEGNGAR
jgi:hypothetical protein